MNVFGAVNRADAMIGLNGISVLVHVMTKLNPGSQRRKYAIIACARRSDRATGRCVAQRLTNAWTVRLVGSSCIQAHIEGSGC